MNVNDPTSIAIDIAVIISSGTILQLLCALCRKKLYPMIATKLFKLEKEKSIHHFSRQLWKFTWHIACLTLELIVSIPSNFWPSIINPYNKQYGTTLFYTNSDDLPSIGIRFLYLIQIGHFSADLLHMLLLDRPNDLINMTVHHIATLSLLWMSYLPSDCWKIGAAVLFVHEIGDVTITFTKALHYAQLEMTSNILFMLHIFIWIWSRLIWFPRIIASIFMDVEFPSKSYWQQLPCGILLCVLLVLHIFWTLLMFKVLYRAFVKKEALKDERDKEIGDTNEKETVMEMEGRTDNVKVDEVPKMHRRRSSLMGSFIVETNLEADSVEV